MTGPDPEPDPLEPGTLDHLAELLGVWAADEAVRDAAGERSRRRWLAEQAAGDATLAGALVDLAERRQRWVVRLVGHSFTGTIDAVGRDFCVVGTSPQAVVALGAVVAVEPAGAAPQGSGVPGDRRGPVPLGMADVLGVLAADRATVTVTVRGGEQLTGTVVLVGVDVVALAPDSGRRQQLVPLAAVEAVRAAPHGSALPG